MHQVETVSECWGAAPDGKQRELHLVSDMTGGGEPPACAKHWVNFLLCVIITRPASVCITFFRVIYWCMSSTNIRFGLFIFHIYSASIDILPTSFQKYSPVMLLQQSWRSFPKFWTQVSCLAPTLWSSSSQTSTIGFWLEDCWGQVTCHKVFSQKKYFWIFKKCLNMSEFYWVFYN